MKKLNLDKPREQLMDLTNALAQIDRDSQRFLDLSELSCLRRMNLNIAARCLKREIIFAQTDLWRLLTMEDQKSLQEPKVEQDYNLEVTFKPKKKLKKTKRKK